MSLAASSLLSERSQAVLARITTAEGTPLHTVWKYMFMCFDTPRPSGKEEAIRNKVHLPHRI
jgi:hypothetical protein